MKNILKYSLLGLGVMITTSCIDTLDTSPRVTFDAETIWGSKTNVEGFVYATYRSVIEDGYAGSGTSVQWEARTPNSVLANRVYGGPGGYVDDFTLETGISSSSDFGISKFSLLRRANMIIENVENSSTLSEAEKTELMAHGYMLRGMIFFQQAKRMGRLVPVKQVFTETDSVACLIPLTKNEKESYEHVISDLKYAAENLPADALPGIPTKWAAKIVLSRAALQAYAYTKDKSYIDIAMNAAKDVTDVKPLSTSSGMFNETDQYASEIIWAYYRESKDTYASSFWELIATYPNIPYDDIESGGGTQLKMNGRFEGWATFFPTQDLVDQFLVTDEKTEEALPWYETSQWKENVTELDPSTITEIGQIETIPYGTSAKRNMPAQQDFTNVNLAHKNFIRYAKLTNYDPKNPNALDFDISDLMYENRDKRFYTAVAYDKCNWMGEDIETCMGGNLYRGVRQEEAGGWYNTVTNYYWRKSSVENPNPRAYHSTQVALHFNLARTGEAWLNLAEAYLLKAETDGSYISKAVDALNQTRTVHGGIAGSKATTLEEAWTDYIRERRCELCNEGGDIYWSYLRWGKYGGYANYGEQPGAIIKDLDRPTYMIQIDSKRSTILVNQVTTSGAAQRAFTERRYLLPVNQGWLNTRETYGIEDNYNQIW